MHSRRAFLQSVAAIPILAGLPPRLRGADETSSAPLEHVTFEAQTPSGRSLGERTVDGQIAQDLDDGSFLLLDRGGRIWPVTPDRLVERETTDEPFAPYSQDEMATALREEFGDGLLMHKTRHYILCSEAPREYAQWAGSLFERLMAAFETLWDRKPLNVTDPEFPLCAVILKDKQRYQEYAVQESGSGVLGALGYYSTLTNRMVMYDLTGGQAPRNAFELNRRLAHQIANVSTIVHEATHQVAFNTKVHTRLAPNPFWLVEGLAMFFETPDLKNPNGWRTVGALNTSRLRDYKEYLQVRHKPGSFREMIASDDKFHDEETALDSYSQAWALSYYLIWARREDYTKYLAMTSQKEMLAQQTAEQRIAEFEEHFGKAAEVERSMVNYLRRKVR